MEHNSKPKVFYVEDIKPIDVQFFQDEVDEEDPGTPLFTFKRVVVLALSVAVIVFSIVYWAFKGG